jgi:AbrB family looped-hinge helix DNA binding protein
MLAKVSSKNQVVIPKIICAVFGLFKGDFVDFQITGKKITMEPKRVVLKDKYPVQDLKAAQLALSKGKAGKEHVFESGDEMVSFFKAKIKK